MRHRKRNAKLGRKGEHRNAMLANLVCSLILNRRITTTLAKAKAARPVAEKMVTLAKKGTLHHRRLAASRLRQEDAARILFHEIAPQFENRNGGYTRIIRLHQRIGDAAPMAILEWVEEAVTSSVTPAEPEPEAAAKAAATAAAEAATATEETEPAESTEAPAEEKTEESAEASAEDSAASEQDAEQPADEEKKDA